MGNRRQQRLIAGARLLPLLPTSRTILTDLAVRRAALA
jgi:hypothetical protein